MAFTKEDKEVLKALVQKELSTLIGEELDAEGDSTPAFLKGEKEYERFLKALSKKIK